MFNNILGGMFSYNKSSLPHPTRTATTNTKTTQVSRHNESSEKSKSKETLQQRAKEITKGINIKDSNYSDYYKFCVLDKNDNDMWDKNSERYIYKGL